MSNPLPEPGGLSFEDEIESVTGTLRPQSIAFIGMHKTGKTTLAASASEIPALKNAGAKVLILEAETGTASIAEDYPDVKLVKVASGWALDSKVDELVTRRHNYGVVVFDTMDKFQEYKIAETIDGAKDTRKAWADVKLWMTRTAWRLHKSGILAIFLFHESDVKNDKTGIVKTMFKLQGGAKDDLGQIFDIIGRLEVKKLDDGKNHRVLQLAPAEGQITGSRYEKKLPEQMIDPTMAKIFELIMNPKATTGEEATTTTTEEKQA